jgi:hypothetical protein
MQKVMRCLFQFEVAVHTTIMGHLHWTVELRFCPEKLGDVYQHKYSCH